MVFHPQNRKDWLRLDLLCLPGIGFAAVAPEICGTVRRIIGGEAAAAFWFDPAGVPLGYHHEQAAPDSSDLFANEFERLFLGDSEINAFRLSRMGGPPCGHLFAPPPSYFRSNTFNLLVRPSGHHHALDLRVDCDDGSRVVVMLFRNRHPPFRRRDLATLAAFEPLLRRVRGTTGVSWPEAVQRQAGRMLLDSTGTEVLACCAEAESLLRACTLFGQGVRLVGPMISAPRFLSELCARHAAGGPGLTRVEIPGGWLSIEVVPMARPGIDAPPLIAVNVTSEAPRGLELLDCVIAQELSPLRSRILTYAAAGGDRAYVPARFGISKESTKKHLSEIYRRVGATGWQDVRSALAKG